MPFRRRPVRVATLRGWPTAVEVDGQVWRVDAVLDYWVVQGRWWAREERRAYLRLLSRGRCLEVYQTREGWYLSRILD